MQSAIEALPQRIVIPLANPRNARALIQLGAALLPPGGTLVALSIVELPDTTPLSDGVLRARQARRLLRRVSDWTPAGVELRTLVRIGRRAADGIVEVAAEEHAQLILFGLPRPLIARDEGEALMGSTIDDVARRAPCDVAVARGNVSDGIRRILVPVRGGPHAGLALGLAGRISAASGAEVVALHVVPVDLDTDLRARARRALVMFTRRHSSERTIPLLIAAPSALTAILHEAERADIVVMGATVSTLDDRSDTYLFGDLPEALLRQAPRAVVVVLSQQRWTQAELELGPDGTEPVDALGVAATSHSVPERVDRWFAESSFHHSEFSDLRALVRLKEQQGLTVSAVFPTLNEAATIGTIVRAARADLMEAVPLLDELLVIDSDSTDETVVIAAAEGARVVRHADVLPSQGTYQGKGEALWKSLHATTGDLIAWSDTDIEDWHPRFLYGTLGPLLTEPRLGYVKAYYQRPIVEDGVLREGGGGRVTELVARPLINLFFPELSGYIQPLSGEYAGRRSYLETIPFFTGYAVEMGHLIDLCEILGLDGLGQVDLDIRIHRNQQLEGLSKMSFTILQAVMKRLEERQRVRLFAEVGATLKLPRTTVGQLSLEVIDLADAERPPMARIPEYGEMHGSAHRTASPEGSSE